MYGRESAQEGKNKRRKIGKGERVRERDFNRKNGHMTGIQRREFSPKYPTKN